MAEVVNKGKTATFLTKRHVLCASDFDREIKLISRELVAPAFNNPDYDIAHNTEEIPITYAAIATPFGVALFDGRGMERTITHSVGIYYDPSVTAENYVLFEGRFLEILRVNDLDERHEWMVLSCSENGSDRDKVNY